MFLRKFKNLVDTILDELHFNKEDKLIRYLFVFFFNMISIFLGQKNRIFIKNNYYYNTEKDWRFFHKKQGLHSYARGFKKRKNILLSCYLILDIYPRNNSRLVKDTAGGHGTGKKLWFKDPIFLK